MLVIGVVSSVLAICLAEQLIPVYYMLLNFFLILGACMFVTVMKRGSELAMFYSLVMAGLILGSLVYSDLHLVGLYCLLPCVPILLLLTYANKKPPTFQ